MTVDKKLILGGGNMYRHQNIDLNLLDEVGIGYNEVRVYYKAMVDMSICYEKKKKTILNQV